jgi:murein DD-endopeptidase MepM/ murein hydrolase activator NlpD
MKLQTALLCTLVVSSFLATASASNSNSVKTLENNVAKRSREVNQIGAQIKTIEKKLGKTNESYIEKAQQFKLIDTKIATLKSDLSQSARKISSSFKKSRKVLHQYLLESTDQNNSDELLKRKIYLKVIQKRVNDLKQSQIESQKLLVMINDYEENLQRARINEEALYSVIVELEGKKKTLGQSYISKMEDKNELEEQLELAIARKRAKKKKSYKKVSRSKVKIDFDFKNPISGYLSRKGSSQGVTYKYDKVSPVKSSEQGQVVYAGELASYGKVIMIDHGKDIRSVILGDINIKVKKGDFISRNGVLGYANVDPGLTKSLYYEIRKKNKVQNTINYL